MTAATARLARAADAEAIARIYTQGIEERIATFETAARSAEQVAAQLAEKGDRFPTVVIEQDGRVVAWATAGPYRSRPAYAGVAEHSVYVDRAARGTGAGRAALEALFAAYAERGRGSGSHCGDGRARLRRRVRARALGPRALDRGQCRSADHRGAESRSWRCLH